MTNPPPLRRAIAAVIRDTMAQQGHSTNALAVAAGMSEPTLRRRLAGGGPFTTDELGAIAEHLGCTEEAVLALARQRQTAA
jgi:DNA-binding Xre family transcriptional regulator